MNEEIEYIKLKVDWYKSIFPWILAMVAGGVALIKSADPIESNVNFSIDFIILSISLLMASIIATWFAALALIHRLEPPYKPSFRILRPLFWTPVGSKWEAWLSFVSGLCLGAGIASFVVGLIFHIIT